MINKQPPQKIREPDTFILVWLITAINGSVGELMASIKVPTHFVKHRGVSAQPLIVYVRRWRKSATQRREKNVAQGLRVTPWHPI